MITRILSFAERNSLALYLGAFLYCGEYYSLQEWTIHAYKCGVTLCGPFACVECFHGRWCFDLWFRVLCDTLDLHYRLKVRAYVTTLHFQPVYIITK